MLKKTKGFALATVLAILVILFVIGASLSIIASNHANFTLSTKNEALTMSAAQAGLSRAIVMSKTAGITTSGPDWSGTNLATALSSLSSANYYDSSNTHVYFTVNVEQLNPAPTSNTALLRSFGYVTSGSNGSGTVLRSKEINAFLHWQYPLSAASAFYSSSCIDYATGGGNPTFTCTGGQFVVSMTCALDTSHLSFPGCTLEDPPSNPSLWPFPDLSISNVIADSAGNPNPYKASKAPTPCNSSGNPLTPPPYSNYFCTGYTSSSYALDQIYNTGIKGSNYFNVPAGTSTTFTMNGNFNSINADCNDISDGPNFLIIRNANLKITGNPTYVGVLIVINGTINIQGSPTFTGNVFATGGIFQGGSGITASSDPACISKMGNLFRPLVMVDSLWVGSQPPMP